MFGMGWAELMIVGIVALIVVGPKELPILFRKMGQFVGKAKGMAREFSRAMNDAADQAGVGDIQKTLNAATNPVNTALQGVKDATTSFTKLDLDPESETGKLAAERAENARKIQAATARKVAERKAREAEEALKKAEEIEAEAEKAGIRSTAWIRDAVYSVLERKLPASVYKEAVAQDDASWKASVRRRVEGRTKTKENERDSEN